jgi:hypothetical protein
LLVVAELVLVAGILEEAALVVSLKIMVVQHLS